MKTFALIILALSIIITGVILTGCPEKPSKPEAGQDEPVVLDVDAGCDTD